MYEPPNILGASGIKSRARRTDSSSVPPLRYPHPLANAGRLTVPASVSTFQTVLARADLVYAQSVLVRTHSKGNLGESLALRAFLRNKFEEGGNWFSLTPRTGRQGFDHLFVRINQNGSYSFMVGESKYGSSQLGVTQGNVKQMSWNWIHTRANKLGDAYINLSNRSNISCRKLPFFRSGIKSYDVVVNNQKVSFWRDSNGNWYFTGSQDQLAQAQKEAAKMGHALKTSKISARLFRIRKSGDDVIISIDRIKSGKNSSTVQIIKGKEIVLKGVLSKHISDEELKRQITEELKKKFPGMSKAEIKELTDDLANKYKNGDLVKKAPSVIRSIAWQSLLAGGISGAIDLALQLLTQRKVNWKRVAVTAVSSAAGAACGQVLAIGMIKTKAGAITVRCIARMAGLRAFSLLRNSLAGSAGGLVTTALAAYGGALLGYTTWKEANRTFIAGASGMAGGFVAGTATTSLVAAFGTCSTGTAISSLSGAAATNATLAWLGGGAASAGGGGMAAGALVLGGIVVVATLVVASTVTWAFIVYDKKDRRQYTLLLEEKFSKLWYKIADNRLSPQIWSAA